MVLLLSAMPAPAQTRQHDAGRTESAAAMADKCRAMMEKHQAMQQKIAKNAERLKDLQAK